MRPALRFSQPEASFFWLASRERAVEAQQRGQSDVPMLNAASPRTHPGPEPLTCGFQMRQLIIPATRIDEAQRVAVQGFGAGQFVTTQRRFELLPLGPGHGRPPGSSREGRADGPRWARAEGPLPERVPARPWPARVQGAASSAGPPPSQNRGIVLRATWSPIDAEAHPPSPAAIGHRRRRRWSGGRS